MSDKTFTQEELDAAVAKAVGDKTSELEAKLAELQDSAEQSEIDKAVAAATAESDVTIKELQSKLDEAVLATANEKKAREELEAKIAEEAEKAAAEARTEERVAAVKEVASFPDDYVESNTERWAAMPDGEFASYVADLKVVAAKSDEGDGKDDLNKETAMQQGRDNGGDNKQASALSDLGFLRKTLRTGNI